MKKGKKSYYFHHYLEQLDFRYRLYLLNKQKNLEKRINSAQDLIYKAFEQGLGIYSCPDLEQPFLDLAKTINTSFDASYTSNSYLHVMTQAYLVGGHTRVVERWIDTSPDNEKHSIVLLNQGKENYPTKLIDVCNTHNGELYLFNEPNLIDRAKRLRDIAFQYEYVILHIHMHDPTAIVAFGTEDFTRPIILFNHADHSYWCGASVVDMLADLRNNQIAYKYRGIKTRSLIRIPFEMNEKIQNFPKNKEESRKILGLPLDKKIVLTVGGAHKYTPFAGCEFCDVVAKTINAMKDVVCYGIGPSAEIGNWSNYGEKFIAVGKINYGDEYFHYLNACDVYINSMPIGGGTAILDAVQFHKPVISFNPFDDKLGDIIEGVYSTNNLKRFDAALRHVLISDNAAYSLACKQYSTVIDNHGIDNWRNNVDVMLSKTPQKHSIHDISNVRYKINDLAIMISLWCGTLSNRKLTIYDIYHCFKRLLHL